MVAVCASREQLKTETRIRNARILPTPPYRLAPWKFEELGVYHFRTAGHDDGPMHRKDDFTTLIQTTMIDFYDSSAVREFALLQHGRFSVDGIAVKHRESMANLRVFQRFDSASTDVGLAHPNHQTNDDRALHQPLPMLRPSGKVPIDMHRVLVHAQQTEQRIVELGDRPARPVPERLARSQFVEKATVFVRVGN